jgi:predicted MPP superfamily phosphohydrolase
MKFRVIVLSLFSTIFLYLLLSWVLPFQNLGLKLALGALLFFAFALILWVPLIHWRNDSGVTSERERIAIWGAFGAMGYLSFVFVLSMLRDIAGIFVHPTLWTQTGSLIILTSAAVLFLVGFFIAHIRLDTKRVEVEFPRVLAAELRGLKVVQISDLHVGATVRKDFVEKVVRAANHESPDLVVVTGDVADGMVKELNPEIEPLSKLEARLGKFYVPGNHEYYWEGPAWISKMSELGFTPLLNDSRVVSVGSARLAIAGVPDPTAVANGLPGPDFAKAIDAIPAEAYPKIVLCHQPKFALDAEKAGFDLQLSGHTHGGQFFPWTLIAKRVHGALNAGLHSLGRMLVYVSRGTGYWGPPVRLGSPPEVTLLILGKGKP